MKAGRFFWATLLALITLMAFARGQQVMEADSTQDVTSSGWMVLPIVYYTPETKLAVAAGGLYFFRDGTNATKANPSAMVATLEYTQLNQIQFELSPDVSLFNGQYRLNAQIGFRKFPATYYGRVNNSVIPEVYTPQSVYARMNLQKKVSDHMTAGIALTYANQRMVKLDEEGILVSGEVPGSMGGVIDGLGATITLDERDNSFFPSTGRFYQGSYMTYQKALGSDFSFNRWKADLRDYYTVGESQVLAVQRYMSIATGTVPFQYVPTLGGKEILRGYPEGYYNGNTVLALQVDYRVTPLWWKLGFTAFAGAGQVVPSLRQLNLASTKLSGGFGIRYLLIEKEKLVLRMDCAWGQNASGVYITVAEAF